MGRRRRTGQNSGSKIRERMDLWMYKDTITQKKGALVCLGKHSEIFYMNLKYRNKMLGLIQNQ